MMRQVIVLVAVAISESAGCTRSSAVRSASPDPVGELTSGFDTSVRRDVETLRNATSRFRFDLAAAGEAGYPTATLPRCIADSTMGGMGHHMIDRRLFDEKLEIDKPEMLIYAPNGEGKMELVGVEYVVPFRAWPATDKAPRLFGQELKRYPEFNYWALHVWAWKRNAAGLFADWNPAIKCS
jgi:hypothetical protein